MICTTDVEIRQECFLERLTRNNELLKNIISDCRKANNDNITVEYFILDCNVIPIYTNIVKSTGNESELRKLKSEFLGYTEIFRQNMEQVRR
ncbi:MAG: hypothetical protein K2J39_07515, partial [Ruminococcus sp.]|nr:hypothetical protein [Ruminococcus sp.]